MSGRRENFEKDSRRNSVARKRSHKEHQERQQQQAQVLARLLTAAREEEAAK